MPSPVPDLTLSFGQLAWVINRGRPPNDVLINQLRYLRQLGIPLTEKEKGIGSGNRFYYNFYHLIECGLGVVALRRGMKPREISEILVKNRAEMHKWFRTIYQAAWPVYVDKLALDEDQEDEMLDLMLTLHNRYSEQPGMFEFLDDRPPADRSLGNSTPPLKKRPEQDSQIVIPLLRYVAGWAAYAKEAPVTRAGRKPVVKIDS